MRTTAHDVTEFRRRVELEEYLRMQEGIVPESVQEAAGVQEAASDQEQEAAEAASEADDEQTMVVNAEAAEAEAEATEAAAAEAAAVTAEALAMAAAEVEARLARNLEDWREERRRSEELRAAEQAREEERFRVEQQRLAEREREQERARVEPALQRAERALQQQLRSVGPPPLRSADPLAEEETMTAPTADSGGSTGATTYRLRLPADVVAGQICRATLPNGKRVQFKAPADAAAGKQVEYVDRG